VDLGAPFLPLAFPGFPGWAALRIAAFAVAQGALLTMTGIAWARFGRERMISDG
jgi:hypothetical protein